MDNTTKDRRFKWIIIFLVALLFSLTIFSFGAGRYFISVGEIFDSLFKKLSGAAIDDKTVEAVLFHVRLPRIAFAILVGAALSIAGACYQGLFKNPLVSSDVIGASSGAAFGAALAILLGLSTTGISLSAFFWSIVAVIIVYLVGNTLKINPILGLVLSGIMIGAVFSSGLSFLKLVADPMDQLPQITYWLMGSLSGTKTEDIIPVAIIMFIAIFMLWASRWHLNLLTFSDEEAKTMGLNVKMLRLMVILCATLLTAASIAVSGVIGWISLAIPHFARLIIGSDYRKLLPLSLLLGSNFLLIVDNISRLTFSSEIPLGIITSLIGAPFFLFLLHREGRRG
ncbi:MAG: iron ABC transporter permease [Eubacteriales bacterium]|nr:iron ABC transporter permease [Eubacteriales bacterium]MDY3333184.1 iron ABC transporter permease [Gallibacter sp.]